MNYYSNEINEIYKILETSEKGLSDDEALLRLEKNGKNKLEEKKNESFFKKLIKEIINPMNIVLIVTALISSLTTIYDLSKNNQKGSVLDFVDVFIILFVVIVNALLGVFQESKAEKSLESLKEMSKSKCNVIRNDKIKTIDEEDLVIGDIVILEAGSVVPVDGRIIESASLKIDESMLTGESIAREKNNKVISKNDVVLADRNNMAYMGTNVTYGRGKLLVTNTGMNTEMGKIARVLNNDEKEKTPLQKKLDDLSKILTFIVLGICVLILLVSVIRSLVDKNFSFETFIDAFMVSISLAVAAIPEGLVSVVTIVLSLGVTRMSKKNAIVRKLTAVETLGCTQIICSDKTGTLTQNKMKVVSSFSYSLDYLVKAMSLCNDANISPTLEVVGEPTEVALVNFALENNFNKSLEEKTSYVRVNELPFDSNRKMMSTLHLVNDEYTQYTKGGLDCLLPRCKKILTNDGVRNITEEDINLIYQKNEECTKNALRVLSCAYRVNENQDTIKEEDLIFIGLVGMIDPIRPEVKDSIEKCFQAGIKVIMITGDHLDTARAIGKELGLITSYSQSISGNELEKLSDEEFEKIIDNINVYARVQPEHKTRIVKMWKKKGKIVAMTGDGVNDAPSIKSADIGIGMGITGTEVTKQVADMVLSDDNFNTITVAVEEGRKIYDNIQKSIHFLLSSNLAEVVAIFIATLCGFTLLQPTHLLWINLITDSLPALALGLEPSEDDIMKRKPRSSKEGIFSHNAFLDILIHGTLIGLITLISYFVGHYMETGNMHINQISHDGMTMAFLTLSLCEIFHSFNMRSSRKSIFQLKKMNYYSLFASLLSFVLMLCVIYIPGLNTIFNFTSINIFELLTSIGLALLIIVFVELYKLIMRLVESNK